MSTAMLISFIHRARTQSAPQSAKLDPLYIFVSGGSTRGETTDPPGPWEASGTDDPQRLSASSTKECGDLVQQLGRLCIG